MCVFVRVMALATVGIDAGGLGREACRVLLVHCRSVFEAND